MVVDYENKNKIYMCHFPGKSQRLQNEIYNYVKKENFKINKNITIVSVVDENCKNTCDLYKQYKFTYSEEAINKQWNMANKIKYISELLKKCKTEYCIVTDARDVVITADLDDEFINKFKSFNCDIVYNATISKFPKVNCNSDYLIDGRNGRFRYLNAGLCVGKTESLLKWYEYLNDNFIKDSKSEQYILREKYTPEFNIKIDGSRKLFRNCHGNDTVWFKEHKIMYLDYGEPIVVNSNLKYKYLLPNGKILKGKIENAEFENDTEYFLSSDNMFPMSFKEKSKLIITIGEKQVDFSYLKIYNSFRKIEFIFNEKSNSKDFSSLIKSILSETCLNCVCSIYIVNMPKNIILPFDERIKILETPLKFNRRIFDKNINRYFKLIDKN